MTPKPPAIFMRTTLALSALTLLTALVGLGASVPAQAYFLTGFEAIVIVACVLGILTGLGRFNDGPAVAIACTAGTIFVGGVLGAIYLYATQPILGVDWRMFLAFRGVIALVLFACAGGVPLARKPRVSIRLLVIGVALGAPVLIALAAVWRVGPVRQALAGMNPTLLALLATPAALLAIGLLSASAHCVIRAFEIGVEAGGTAAEASPEGGPGMVR